MISIKKILKLFLFLLIFNFTFVFASSYGIKYEPIENLDLKVEETKKYRFYKEEKIEAFFLEDEEPNGFNKTNNFYYTDYSEWFKVRPIMKKNREIKERTIYNYRKYKKIKHVRLEIDDEDESLLRFAVYINNVHSSCTYACTNCTTNYSLFLDNESVAAHIGRIDLYLESYYEPDVFSLKVRFNKANVNYKISLYGSDKLDELLYEKTFISGLDLKNLYIDNFNPIDPFEYDIKTEEILDMPVTSSYKEYAYKDKYYKYEFINRIYYPTYEENVDDYIKDENDYITSKKYFYLEKAFIKDKIVINNENYDLTDYVKTSLPFETSSNIDISKNGTYKVKYIFKDKTIEKNVQVKTNNEYLKSLEDELKKKKEEIISITNDKNDLIERYESNLKSKDEIISKKQVENHIVKSSPLPIILITMGVMLIIFVLFKSFKNVELKK